MKAEWVEMVEATGAAAPDDHAWAQAIVDRAASLFATRTFTGGIALTLVRHSADCSRVAPLVGSTNREWVGGQTVDADGMVATLGPGGVRALYYPPKTVAIQSEMVGHLPRASREFMASYRRRYEMIDGMAICVHPEPGLALVLCGGYAGHPAPVPTQRRLLTQVALHLEAGYRLRRRPEAVLAVIRPDGKIVHHEAGAPHPTRLSQRAKRIEAVRTRRRRREPQSLALWKALVDGRATLVERSDGGQRFYFVVENAPARQPFQALTPAEVDTVSHATRGLSAKLIAYGLGVSEPTVSARLASAAAKVGLCTRLELVRLAAMLTRDPRARFEQIALTTAERDVLELLQQGLSNHEISAIRDRSVRTIANQVAGLLRKTNSVGRRAIASRPL